MTVCLVSHVTMFVSGLLPQTMRFVGAEVVVTFRAAPSFISSRKTNNPVLVLTFSVMVVLGLGGFIIVGTSCSSRAAAAEAAFQAEHRHKQDQIVKTAKEAHESTIALACNHLR